MTMKVSDKDKDKSINDRPEKEVSGIFLGKMASPGLRPMALKSPVVKKLPVGAVVEDNQPEPEIFPPLAVRRRQSQEFSPLVPRKAPNRPLPPPADSGGLIVAPAGGNAKFLTCFCLFPMMAMLMIESILGSIGMTAAVFIMTVVVVTMYSIEGGQSKRRVPHPHAVLYPGSPGPPRRRITS
jgi:hypothetical protein